MQQLSVAESLGENVHKLPMQPAKKPARVSKAMRALLETTVTEAEDRAYARGYEEGAGQRLMVLTVGLCGGGVSGFLMGLAIHLVAHAAK